MPRPLLKLTVVLGAWLCGLGATTRAAFEDFTFHHENVMGTSLELRVRAATQDDALRAEERVLGEIDRLSAIFSSYDRTSELSRWQESAAPTPVSPELFEILQASDHWSDTSGGAFDPRTEALSRLWARAARQDRLPSAAERDETRTLMRPAAWRLDSAARTAQHLSACPLTFNAIAKGDIVERACTAALDRRRGVSGVLLNVGGDLHVGGDLVQTIGIASPRAGSETADPIATIEVRDRSVATSGNAHRGFLIQGKWYSHILDPRSGMPVEQTSSATVIADRGADADALATIFNVLTVAESLRLARSVPGVECLLVTTDGRVVRSDGWARYEKPKPVGAVLAHALEAQGGTAKGEPGRVRDWGDEFEVVVRLEINSPDGSSRRYRRPYVAVWVEDKDGASVRTLVLWVQKKGRSQWVRDLRRWYRSDQARLLVGRTDVKGTMSGATRSAGRYEVLWDGKDDHGKSLPRGDYTIFIEAAREHGTYQIIRQPITLANQPFVEDLKGNVEIKSASVEYRRKGAPR